MQEQGEANTSPIEFLLRQAMGRFLQRSTPNSAVDFLAPASALDAMGHDERVSFFFLLCRGLTTDSGDGHSENAQQNRRFLVWFSRILFSESEELRADALHNTAVGLIGEQQYRTAISLLVGERSVRRRIATNSTHQVNNNIQLAVAFDALRRTRQAYCLLEQACALCDSDREVHPQRADLAYRLMAAAAALRGEIGTCLELLGKAEAQEFFQPLSLLNLHLIWVDAICSQAFIVDKLPGTLMFVAVQAIRRLQENGVPQFTWRDVDLLTPQLERTRFRFLGVLSTGAVLRYVTEVDDADLSFGDLLILKNNYGNALLGAGANQAAQDEFLETIALAGSRLGQLSDKREIREVKHQVGIAWSGVGFSAYNMALLMPDEKAGEAFRSASAAFRYAEESLNDCGLISFRDSRMWACRGATHAHLSEVSQMLYDFSRALLGYNQAFKSISDRNDDAWGNFFGLALSGEISGERDALATNPGELSAKSAVDPVHHFFNPDSDTRLKCAEGTSIVGLSHLAVFFAKLAVKSVYETSLPNVSQLLAEDYVISRAKTHLTLMNYLALAGRYNEAEQLLTLIKKDRQAAFLGRGDLILDAEAHLSFTKIEAEAVVTCGLGALMLSCANYGGVNGEVIIKLSESLQQFQIKVEDQMAVRALGVERRYQETDTALRRMLAPSCSFIRFIVTATKTVAIVYTSSERTVVETSISSGELAGLVTRLRQACRVITSLTSEEPKEPAKALHSALLLPLSCALPSDTKHLYLDCGPVLQGLPFGALYDGVRYLAEQYSITYVASSIDSESNEPSEPTDRVEKINFYLCGDLRGGELPGVLAEGAKSVERLKSAGVPARILESDDVTSASLVNDLTMGSSGPSVIHIATHANFNVTSDLLSCISLNDGPLSLKRLRESLEGKQCQLPLLILSACGTARADVDVEGFAYTLLQAGVKEILATLWETVDMSGATFFSVFYQEWGASSSSRRCAAAIQAAQIAMIGSNEQMNGIPLRHPAHWAAFVSLTGLTLSGHP